MENKSEEQKVTFRQISEKIANPMCFSAHY